MVNSLDYDTGRQLLYADAFLHSLLTAEDARSNKYMFTRAVAAVIFHQPGIDGIAFPSNRDSLGYNVALKSETVGTKIHPVSCLYCGVDRLREFGFVDYRVVRDAVRIDTDGMFEWADPLTPNRRRFFNLSKEEYETALKHYHDQNAFIEVMRVGDV